MEIKLVTAMIASGTALAGAALSLIVGARNQKKQAAAIEQLRFSLDEEKIRLAKEREKREEAQKCIDQALECIQKIKDRIYFIQQQQNINSQTLDSIQKARAEIKNYVDLFSSIYQKVDVYERMIAHDMKNQFFRLDSLLSIKISQVRRKEQLKEMNFEEEFRDILGKISHFQDIFLKRRGYYL